MANKNFSKLLAGLVAASAIIPAVGHTSAMDTLNPNEVVTGKIYNEKACIIIEEAVL